MGSILTAVRKMTESEVRESIPNWVSYWARRDGISYELAAEKYADKIHQIIERASLDSTTEGR